MKTLLLTWLDRILIADVFLVLLGFFWFAIAVVGESTGIPLGYQIWQKLWLPLFNPAISILILGAISSWGIKKLSQWFTAKQGS
ncbi:hypothetical protein IQ225_07165 [Synechocystis salina LEGE 06155]|uniref:hypothetical protein n=1 Tax=Synechocystis TaxID=1142 RepID=UPI0016873032|nr:MULTISPECIES: hypothetical protein [Synechocystis]MBE9175147.1 hypothetical protein [Synechocystis salina LEGE 06155]MBD2652881.1 hypothetical protein [Synechocystis sp. FACHB-383]MBE9196336.1 hypothetical protein [Synechocystis sp. LEGE 06083]MBE9203157.1 hypothetical protein [Synechocystis salina LEGE 06099]QUS60264.1 hypothetical protein HTZ78_05960 [Synechocystis sp. PCC 7338]